MNEAPTLAQRMAAVALLDATLPKGTGAVVIFVTKTTDHGEPAALISSVASVSENVARQALAGVLARYEQGEAHTVEGGLQ